MATATFPKPLAASVSLHKTRFNLKPRKIDMQTDELSYAIITPYSMRKSRTGGIDLRKSRHRRLNVGDKIDNQRDEIAALREVAELVW